MTLALRILVVEDEVLIAMMLEDMLADMGHDVTATAHSFDRALTAVRAGEFDLAILDVNLGTRSSRPLAEELYERGIPFVVATGDEAACLQTSFFGATVVSKPFDEATLAAALSAAVR